VSFCPICTFDQYLNHEISQDDLNTLYVYEAKMSFFIRMGQSRPGAERLLEAQLLPILAQCDYLDTRPEADQSFLGMAFNKPCDVLSLSPSLFFL
jgi:hypothetical protein